MNSPIKIALYAVLVILACVSGFFALSSFGRMMDRGADRTSPLEEIEPERPAAPVEEEVTPAITDPALETTNSAEILTNDVAASTNLVESTNQIAAVAPTNATPPPVVETESTPVEPAVPTALGTRAGASEKAKPSRIGLWTGIFVISVIGLGLLIANDVSHLIGNRALKTLYNDEGEGVANPEYEQAEETWAKGRHLEAIGMMREYLKKNPREQHVAIRIAEIYEKDLRNYLAAALEYEEVLNHKLPDERWGWAAIHLCNLYFKLNQEQKAFDLLRRLVKEKPGTAAAEKARKRLEQVEGASGEQIAVDPQSQVRKVDPPTTPSAPPSNLPPGFRPKK